MNSLRIRSNTTSALAYRNLAKNQHGLQTTLERLSSGLRINKASDDVAGSAISTRMSNQIRGMKQANENAQQANNLVQTAENGLNDISDILSRMRELAVQASTDTLNDTDRASINLEFQASKNEIGRIADSTKYNGISLLKGFNPKMDFLSGQSYKASNATTSKSESPSIPISTTLLEKTGEKSDMPHVSNEIIVRFSTDTLDNLNIDINEDNKSIVTSSNQINQLFEEMQVIEIDPVFTTKISPLSQFYKLKLAPNQQVAEIIQELNDDPIIESAELNYIVKKSSQPNDPLLEVQWGLTKIDAEQGWEFEKGNPDITVAVIDTGVDYNHEDLTENMWTNQGEIPSNGIDDDNNNYVDDYYGRDFSDNDSDPNDGGSHGTHVAGTIAAVTNNGKGVAGTNWHAKIMAVRVLPGTTFGVSRGIEYATNAGADVINMSLTGGRLSHTEAAISYAYNSGVTLVAAAGNSNTDSKYYPAANPNVISVGSTNSNDEKSWFSNYGDWVEIAAPGSSIQSTVPNDNYASKQGTSMASPHVAGLASLVLSQNPDLTPDQVREVIRFASDKIEWMMDSTIGRINMASALAPDFAKPAEFSFQIGTDNDAQGNISISIESAKPYILEISNADVANVDEARESIRAIDGAIDFTNNQKVGLSSIQNRLVFTMSNLTSQTQNIEASRSTIEDADFAAEAADLAKNQILAQSATAMLAQASAISQNILSLLR